MSSATRNPSRPMPEIKNQLRPLSNYLGYINDFVVCPYNDKHVMKYHKLMRHLVKCEKQMINAEAEKKGGACTNKEITLPVGYERCPYDSLHRFRSDAKDEHFRFCKARNLEFMARIANGEDVQDLDSRLAYKTDEVEGKKETDVGTK